MNPDLTLALERKLRQEYEQLVEELYGLSQINVYSTTENRFLFPDINLQVYQITLRTDQIAKELEFLTGVKVRSSLIEDVILE